MPDITYWLGALATGIVPLCRIVVAYPIALGSGFGYFLVGLVCGLLILILARWLNAAQNLQPPVASWPKLIALIFYGVITNWAIWAYNAELDKLLALLPGGACWFVLAVYVTAIELKLSKRFNWAELPF
jgi:hypothetical protein